MDRKSIIILAVSFILLFAWYPLIVNKVLYPPKPLPPGSTNRVSQPISTATNAVPAPAGLTPTQPVASLAAPSTATTEQVEEKTIELTNATTHYTFTSAGGGLKQVELLKYPESVASRGRKQVKSDRVATLNSYAPAPALAIQAGDALQAGVFELTRTANGVRAERTLTNGLVVIKEFTPSTNYLLVASIRIENRGSNAVTLPPQDWIVGTATPMGPDDQGRVIGAYWYNGHGKKDVGPSFFSSSGFACIPRTPPSEYRAGESNVVWVAVHNQFFALAAMPEKVAQQVVVQKINLPHVSGQAAGTAGNGKPAAGYIAAMVYPAFTLEPGQAQDRTIHIFAGPKEYQTLARIGNRFQNNLDLVMGFGFFGFFAKALLLTMNWLHDALRFSYGWAIIVITVIIKTLFWPLTQASTRSMKRLQALQPQMKAIQEKYKDDPAKMNRKTMEFMREHKVSPLGGCLPMLLQIPVFFGFYQMIQSAIELRGEGWLWVSDLSKPDTLFTIPGTEFPFNLLPLLMGATMLWQARLTPPSPGMDPAQAKIMRYMPLMFMVFLYNFSAGLTLYWTVQNLLTIAQTKITKAKEEPGQTPVKGPALTPAPKKRK